MSRHQASILVIASALALPLAALAQTASSGSTGSSTSTTSASSSSTSTSKPESRLVADYSKLAGSRENATSLVTGLRNGTEVTLTSADGKKTTFTPPTGRMGNGEIDIALALAEKRMAADPKLSLSGALMGTDSTKGILQMRASGMGWGQVAHELGFKVGDVKRSDRAESRREDRAERREHRAERGEKPEHANRPERPERHERGGR